MTQGSMGTSSETEQPVGCPVRRAGVPPRGTFGYAMVTRRNRRDGNEAASCFYRDSGELRRFFGRRRWLFGCLNDG